MCMLTQPLDGSGLLLTKWVVYIRRGDMRDNTRGRGVRHPEQCSISQATFPYNSVIHFTLAPGCGTTLGCVPGPCTLYTTKGGQHTNPSCIIVPLALPYKNARLYTPCLYSLESLHPRHLCRLCPCTRGSVPYH
jgi:hypothetical protein